MVVLDWAAVTRYHRLDGLKKIEIFFLIGLKTGSLRSGGWHGGFSASWPCEQ